MFRQLPDFCGLCQYSRSKPVQAMLPAQQEFTNTTISSTRVKPFFLCFTIELPSRFVLACRIPIFGIACGLCIHYSRHISNVHSITCFLSASINPTLQELVHFAPVLSGTFITSTSSKQDVRNYSSFYTRIDPLTSIKCTSRQHVLPVRAGFAQISNVW